MIRTYLIVAGEAVCIALSISVVILFCAVGCMMNKRDAYTAHNVHGFRAPIVSQVSHNK